MKKLLAAAISAALTAGSCLPVLAESETVFEPSTVVGELSVTAEGETMSFTITAEEPKEDFVSFSASVTLPASMMGTEEPYVIGVNDVARVISGDLYINVDEIMGVYAELTGDTSTLVSLAAMVGISQSWVEIPALDMTAVEVETEVETELDPDEILTQLEELAASFDVQTTDEGVTVTFDGADVVAVWQLLESISDSWAAAITDTAAGANIDVTGIFSDYILAAAEGINAVTPDVAVEDAEEMIRDVINQIVDETLDSVEVTPLESESGGKVSEELQALLDQGAQIDGVCTLTDSGLTLDFVVAYEESEDTFSMSFDGSVFQLTVAEDGTETAAVNGTIAPTESGFEYDLVFAADGDEAAVNGSLDLSDGLAFIINVSADGEEVSAALNINAAAGTSITDASVPEATLLRDVVKNAVIVFYGLSQDSAE